MTVSVLGTEYQIIRCKYGEEPSFARSNIIGYCNSMQKMIVYGDLATFPGYESETMQT